MTIVQRLARRLSMPHLSLHAKLLIALGCALSLYGGASALAALGDEMLAQPLPSGNRVSADIVLDDLAAQTDRLAAQTQQYIASDTLRAGDTIAAALATPACRRSASARLRAQRCDRAPPVRLASRPHDHRADRRERHAAMAAIPGSGSPRGRRRQSGYRERCAAGPCGASRAYRRTIARGRTKVWHRKPASRCARAPSPRRLFAATDAADVPDAITMQIAEIFDSEIDFHVDLRRGDTFRVVYETLCTSTALICAPDGCWRSGSSTPALLTAPTGSSRRRAKAAITPKTAKGLRKAFLRSPIEFLACELRLQRQPVASHPFALATAHGRRLRSAHRPHRSAQSPTASSISSA